MNKNNKLIENEQHVVCCLLDDWCMLYQLVGTILLNTEADEPHAVNDTFEIIIRLLKKGYIEVGSPAGDGKGGFDAWEGTQPKIIDKVLALKPIMNENWRGSVGTSGWVQLSDKGLQELKHLSGE